jgi:transcription elongation factor Elf1
MQDKIDAMGRKLDEMERRLATKEIPTTKRCGKCGETKPLSAFSKDCTKRDRHHTQCKVCGAEYQASIRVCSNEQSPFKQAVASAVHCVEKALIIDAIRRCGGNRRLVSRELGLSYRSVLYKIERYGIKIAPPTPKEYAIMAAQKAYYDVQDRAKQPTIESGANQTTTTAKNNPILTHQQRIDLVREFDSTPMDAKAFALLARKYGVSLDTCFAIIEAHETRANHGFKVQRQ